MTASAPSPARRSLLIGLAAAALGSVGLAACQNKPASHLDRIRQSKTLKVGLEGTYPPFSFQDAKGQLTGFDVEFAKALAQRLGVQAKIEPAPFAGLLGAMESGRIDVVINQITMTPERQAHYGFSQPYTVSGIQIITLKDRSDISSPADLKGKAVGVGLGTNYESWLRANVPQAVVRTYDDDATKYQDLKAKRIDAVLNDRLVAADFIKRSGEPFKAAGPAFAAQKQGVAFEPDPAFKAAIDQAIDAMRADGTMTRLSDTWFGVDATR